MEELLIQLVQKYPALMIVVVIIGVFRAVFKPAMSLLEAYVKSTPSESDDKKLEGFKASKFYQGIVYAVDYLLSIKLPKA